MFISFHRNVFQTGILDKETRLEVINDFNDYESNIDIIIDKYLEESKIELIEFVQKEFEGKQLKYFFNLLGI